MAWQIDQSHSLIQFSVKHMMIAKVRGFFEEFNGSINLDQNNPSETEVEVSIKTASINTRQSQRDEHLRSPDFFDSENYPEMHFISTKVELLSENTAKLYGNLTIKDITKEVVLDVKFNGLSKSPFGTTNAGFEANGIINRKDWDLNWNQTLETGGFLVGDQIEINIELELIKQ
ncbi:MAG: polyisoprenoid-binding protein [Anaerolineaceae bacterium]|nr:polyisoprenoid-binding protein [Anaerolineaceae bacterium]